MWEYFCNMLIHKGEILEKVVRRLRPNLSRYAKDYGADRRTMLNHFKNPNLQDHIIRKHAETLNYNFKEEFPELYSKWVVGEPEVEYMLDPSTGLLQRELDRFRSMYIKVLEEKTDVLQQLADCRKQLAGNVSQ